jgi:hypothetical protein
VVVCVALNGYQIRYRPALRSHRRYCRRYGYGYVLADRPRRRRVPRRSAAWLKIDLVLAALRAGHPAVLLVDADARISGRAPDFRTVFVPGKDVYLANGRSGRPNSGVIVARDSAASRGFFARVRESADRPAPDGRWGDWVDWGENGHVISAWAGFGAGAELDPAWNNTTDPGRPDYIRHQTGPAWASQRPRLGATARRYAAALWSATLRPLDPLPAPAAGGVPAGSPAGGPAGAGGPVPAGGPGPAGGSARAGSGGPGGDAVAAELLRANWGSG